MAHDSEETRASRAPGGREPARIAPVADVVLDALDEPVAVVGQDGLVVFANAAYRRRFQAAPDGPRCSIRDVAGPFSDQAEGQELAAIVRRGDGAIDLTVFGFASEPEPCTIRVRTLPDDPEGRRIVTLIDSADRQRLEAELKMKGAAAARERELLRAVAATFDEPVLVLDDAERLLLANGAASRAFGLVETDAAGRSLAELPIPPAIRGSWLAFLASPKLEGSARIRVATADGQADLQLAMRRPRNRSGSPLGCVLVAGACTPDREAAAERKAFVLALGHELRTPLVSIQGFAETLAGESDLDPALRREFTGIVLNETERLGRLVENLLQVTRLDGGTGALDRRVLDLHALVRRAVESAVRDEPLDPDFVHLAPPTRRAAAFVDEPLVRETMRQLLRNAAEYAADGGPVDVAVVPGEQEHEILVRDRGPGIPPERLATIFEPFAHDPAGLPGTGAGLGLHLSRRVALAHGGSIRAERPDGGGLRIALRFPAR